MIQFNIGKFNPDKKAVFLAVAGFLVLVGLGTWQLQRLESKTQMLAQIESQMARPAVPLPEEIANPEEWEYRRVTMAGVFLHDHEFLIGPRTLDGKNGYHMLVPFHRASGGIVFVNRGWVANDVMDQVDRPGSIMRVEGVVQVPKKSSFTPDNDPAKGNWYWADIPAMMGKAGLKEASAIVVNISEGVPGVYPVGGKLRVDIANNHLQYAIFWYVMALVLVGVFFIRFRQPEGKNDAADLQKA